MFLSTEFWSFTLVLDSNRLELIPLGIDYRSISIDHAGAIETEEGLRDHYTIIWKQYVVLINPNGESHHKNIMKF